MSNAEMLEHRMHGNIEGFGLKFGVYWCCKKCMKVCGSGVSGHSLTFRPDLSNFDIFKHLFKRLWANCIQI